MSDLKNKVAIITGAASGIGQATAVHFASLGCYLSLGDLSSLEATRQQCIQEGLPDDKILTKTGDVSQSQIQLDLVNDTVGHFGKLDVLINCAGICRLNQTLTSTTMEELDHTLDVNFKSMLALIQLSTPHLKKTKGTVVNVSSRAAKIPELFSLPYCVSKAGVDQLTKFAAKELAPFHVRVNSVNPDIVKTNIILKMLDGNKQLADEMEQKYGNENLFGRIGLPIEIAKPIAFLASGDSSYITGINMLIDGGRCLM